MYNSIIFIEKESDVRRAPNEMPKKRGVKRRTLAEPPTSYLPTRIEAGGVLGVIDVRNFTPM